MHKLFCFLLALSFLSCIKKNLESDISKIATLHKKAEMSLNDSTLLYIKKAKQLIEKNEKLPDTLRIDNIFSKGHYYKRINKLDSASYYFHRAIDLIKPPNNRKKNIFYFRNTWETDEATGNFTNAISIAQKFIEISNEIDNIDELVYTYSFLEKIYLELGNSEKSEFYNTKANETTLKAKNTNMYLVTAFSKANQLYNLGKTSEAFNLLDSLRPISINIAVKRQLYRTYGILNYHEENYKEAIKHYKVTIALSKQIEENYNYNMLESYNNIAEAHIKNKNYRVAEKYLDSSKALITSSSHADYLDFYYELRFQLNYSTKKNSQALIEEYLELIKSSKKRYEEKIDSKLDQLKLALEKEEEERIKAEKQKKKSLMLLIISILLGLFILIGYLFFRQRQLKFQREELQMQQRLLRSQMNPHFIFNTLSLIKNQIKNNRNNAENYLVKFSRLLRLILENSLNNYVQIGNELESIKKYMELQLIRFPDKFKYTINLENFEEDELLFIPPMLIQPFVENSIEHGFSKIDYLGTITINLSLKNKWIYCNIEDNGIGFGLSNSKIKNSTSVRLISKFIAKTTKQDIEIIDKKNLNKNTNGVTVKFLIPYKLSSND